MKFTCTKDNLARALTIANHAVASRSTLPVTHNVLLTASPEGQLRLSTTNLELSISTWIPAEVEREGATTVPCRLLTELVSSLPSEPVTMEVPDETNLLNLTCRNAKSNITITPADQFPELPKRDHQATAAVDPKELRTGISRVDYAAAKEESRPVLTGIQVKLTPEHYTLAAADGFRLAVHQGDLVTAPERDIEAIIPARTLTHLGRLLSDQEKPVIITMNENNTQITFDLANAQVTSQIIQGTFPSFDQLIPKEHTFKGTFTSADLLRATKTAAIFAKGGSDIIRIELIPERQGDRVAGQGRHIRPLRGGGQQSGRGAGRGAGEHRRQPDRGQDSIQQPLPPGGSRHHGPRQDDHQHHLSLKPGSLPDVGHRVLRTGRDANVCSMVVTLSGDPDQTLSSSPETTPADCPKPAAKDIYPD